MLEVYYFTHGSDAGGGWTKVLADSYERAVEAYCLYHPRRDGFIDCCEVYDPENFQATKMYRNGNFGKRCVEEIRLVREEVSGT